MYKYEDEDAERPPAVLMDEIERYYDQCFGPEAKWYLAFHPTYGMHQEAQPHPDDKNDYGIEVWLKLEHPHQPEPKFEPSKTEFETRLGQALTSVLNTNKDGWWRMREAFGKNREEAIRDLWRKLFLGSDLEY